MKKRILVILLLLMVLLASIASVSAVEKNQNRPSNVHALTGNIITRADMEKALAEVAWTYYFMGNKYQYDSISLNNRSDLHLNGPLCGYCGGYSRLSLDASPEDASSDTAIFTVCSGYCFDVYKEAFDYSILGNKFNCLTMTLWRNTSYPDEMAILRWHSKGEGNLYNAYDTEFSVNYDGCWYDADEVLAFFQNYETTMRPGDIIVFDTPGHAMLYVGNGVVLDANGTGKYKMESGLDAWESDGTVDYSTIETKFLNPNDTNFYVGNLGWTENSIVIVRPLNLLTVDDGDDDLGNDLLNTEYELDTGLLKTTLSTDTTTQLKTTGFTIEESTYTRMLYPVMNVDRTVNITPFGTAIRGQNITYSVKVSNNSNNAYYLAYHGAGYSGTAYEGLAVVENIPGNTVFVSATGNYTKVGNTLYWTVDVPVGETVEMTYTVKVTGQIGDEIVCGGGFVANLSTNTIINRIGGTKLDYDDASLSAFFAAGREGWNGVGAGSYFISAGTDEGTQFAERIYNEAFGKELNFPDLQEIADIFFEKTIVHQDYGFYLYYSSSGITKHMYKLRESAPQELDKKLYYDMLVKDYYGGVWVWSDMHNGSSRTIELRESYLETGDVLVYMNLTESDGNAEVEREVEGWRVLVYLGDGRYASLTSKGRLEALEDTTGLSAAFSYDMFVCLRPSQVYENINNSLPNYDIANRPDADDVERFWTYVSNPSNVFLNSNGVAKLAAINISGTSWSKVNTPFVGEVYSKIGIDVVSNGTNDASFASIMKTCFEDAVGTTIYRVYGHDYSLMSDPMDGVEKQRDMLLYYDGYCFDDTNDRPINSMHELHPGDVVMLGSRKSSFYVIMVYKGNGEFLMNVQSLKLAGINSKIWCERAYSDNQFIKLLTNTTLADFAETLDTSNSFNHTAAAVSALQFENYLVLRPSRAFEDINSMLMRDITLYTLTDDEQNSISELSVDDWKSNCNSRAINNILPWVYREAKVDITSAVGYAAKDHIGIRNAINSNDGYYSQMLVANSLGIGTIDPTQLQIGDILCGWVNNPENVSVVLYYTAICQGVNDYLVIYELYDNGRVTATADMTDTQISAIDFETRWILRPEQLVGTPSNDPGASTGTNLPRYITDGALTESEIGLIENINLEKWAINCNSISIKNVLPWVYQEAGIDITAHMDYACLTVNGIRNLFYTTASASTPGYTYYNDMLIEGSLGTYTSGIGTQYYKTGDIFCGKQTAVLEDNSRKNLYYVAIYIGMDANKNHNFLVFYDKVNENNTATGAGAEIMTAETLGSQVFDYRFVLRPELLALRRISDNNTLTVADQMIISSLTYDDWIANCSSRTLQYFLPWVYREAGIDVTGYADYASISVANVHSRIRSNAATNLSGYVYYNNLLVPGSYQLNGSATDEMVELQIGDIFCGYEASAISGKYYYYVAVYKGSGVFFAVYDVLNDTGTKHILGYSESITAEELIAKTTLCRYVLRPTQLSGRSITSGRLSEIEQYVISSLTVNDWLATHIESKRNLDSILPWVYEAAGIDVTEHDLYTSKTVSGALTAIGNGDEYYTAMLVEDSLATISQSGPAVGITDWHIGDIFCGYVQNNPTIYYVAIYQGNDNFLAFYDIPQGSGKVAGYGVLSKTDLYGIGFRWSYVLRPSQLAINAEN